MKIGMEESVCPKVCASPRESKIRGNSTREALSIQGMEGEGLQDRRQNGVRALWVDLERQKDKNPGQVYNFPKG